MAACGRILDGEYAPIPSILVGPFAKGAKAAPVMKVSLKVYSNRNPVEEIGLGGESRRLATFSGSETVILGRWNPNSDGPPELAEKFGSLEQICESDVALERILGYAFNCD